MDYGAAYYERHGLSAPDALGSIQFLRLYSGNSTLLGISDTLLGADPPAKKIGVFHKK